MSNEPYGTICFMKIVFFGSPPFSIPVLSKLQEQFEVIKVIDQTQDLSEHTLKELQSLEPDVFVVASFGKIIPHEFLAIPRLGSINIHPSLLPKYRGPSPIQTAILNGEKVTGVTFFKMDEQLDHGPVIEQFEAPIEETDTFESLGNRLFTKASEELVGILRNTETNQLKPQDDEKATETKKLTREDGYIDLDKLEVKNLKLKIRAYYPWPGVWSKFKLNGGETIIKLLPDAQVQVEGKKPVSYKDFLNGYPKGAEFLKRLSLS